MHTLVHCKLDTLINFGYIIIKYLLCTGKQSTTVLGEGSDSWSSAPGYLIAGHPTLKSSLTLPTAPLSHAMPDDRKLAHTSNRTCTGVSQVIAVPGNRHTNKKSRIPIAVSRLQKQGGPKNKASPSHIIPSGKTIFNEKIDLKLTPSEHLLLKICELKKKREYHEYSIEITHNGKALLPSNTTRYKVHCEDKEIRTQITLLFRAIVRMYFPNRTEMVSLDVTVVVYT